MNFSELFIRRPVMTVVLTASAILFGLLLLYGNGDLSAPEFIYQGF